MNGTVKKNNVDFPMTSPLYLTKRFDIAELLLKHKADITLYDIEERTAIDVLQQDIDLERYYNKLKKKVEKYKIN